MWIEVRLDNNQQQNFLFHTSCETPIDQLHSKISQIVQQRSLLIQILSFFSKQQQQQEQEQQENDVVEVVDESMQQVLDLLNEMQKSFIDSEQLMMEQRACLSHQKLNEQMIELKNRISKLSLPPLVHVPTSMTTTTATTATSDSDNNNNDSNVDKDAKKEKREAMCDALLRLFDENQKLEKQIYKNTKLYLFGKQLNVEANLNKGNKNDNDEKKQPPVVVNRRRGKKVPVFGTLSYHVGTNEKTKVNMVVDFSGESSDVAVVDRKIENEQSAEEAKSTKAQEEAEETREKDAIVGVKRARPAEFEYDEQAREQEEQDEEDEEKSNPLSMLQATYNESFFNSDQFNTMKKRKIEARKKRKIGRRSLRVSKEFALSQQKLNFIGMSNYLKSKLSDPMMQKMILDVDTAYNRESYLQIMMENVPEFNEFCNELLYLVDGKEDNIALEKQKLEQEEQVDQQQLQESDDDVQPSTAISSTNNMDIESPVAVDGQ